MLTHITSKALIFAIQAHQGQKRKYTGEPFIMHPVRVAEIVKECKKYKALSDDHIIIQAALLHDVVEDTDFTLDSIQECFGREVAKIVRYCTKVDCYGSRSVRKKLDREFWQAGPPESQTIKVADMLDNCPSINKYDKVFYEEIYKPEKIELLKVLDKAEADLIQRAAKMLGISSL